MSAVENGEPLRRSERNLLQKVKTFLVFNQSSSFARAEHNSNAISGDESAFSKKEGPKKWARAFKLLKSVRMVKADTETFEEEPREKIESENHLVEDVSKLSGSEASQTEFAPVIPKGSWKSNKTFQSSSTCEWIVHRSQQLRC